MIRLLSRTREHLQLDRSLGFALATRVWQTISGPVTIVLLIRSLSLSEQGVYYAFVGIISIQAYFELGLLNVLVSHAGHEWAAMNETTPAAAKQWDEQRLRAAARMRDLIRTSRTWFTSASLLFVLIAIAFGWYTLRDSSVGWRGPLLLLAPVAAVSVAFAPAISILEGAGQRELVYRYRFLQMVVGSLGVWLALAAGLKLYALVVASGVQAAMAAYVVLGEKGGFFRSFRGISASSRFSWWRDVLPFQWRVALITAALHFATQFFTVIVVMFHSDVAAAPLGMTLSVTTAIQMLALAWVQTKYPVVAADHGAGRREQAGLLWRRTAVISSTLLIVGFGALATLISCLPLIDPDLQRRFVSPGLVLVLAVGCLANHLTSIQGFYVLARRARPLLKVSLAGAAIIATCVWIGGYYYAAAGVLIGYTVGMTFGLFPLHTLAYLQFRRESEGAM